MFEKSGICLKAFECYEYEEDWEGLLLCLSRNKDKFQTIERDSLINRYVPIALNSIYQIMNEKGVDEENRGKALEQKYKNKKIEIIEEESDYSDESEADINQDKENKKDQEEGSQAEEIKDKETEEAEDQEADEEMINTDSKEQSELNKLNIKKKNESDISNFSIISKGDFAQDFEHLSNFDPEDEFLKSENSFSIIGSVLCKDEDSISEYSDYSILSGSRIEEIKGGNILNQNRDLQTEDLVIQKIIYYISMFSDDVKQFLGRLRSNEGLLGKEKADISVDNFELELDNLDDEMLTVILDILEHFDMFRL